MQILTSPVFTPKCHLCGTPLANPREYECEDCQIKHMRKEFTEARQWLEKEITWLLGFRACYMQLTKRTRFECNFRIKIKSYLGKRRKYIGWEIQGVLDGEDIEYPNFYGDREYRQALPSEFDDKDKDISRIISDEVFRIMDKLESEYGTIIESHCTLLLCGSCNELATGEWNSRKPKHKECIECLEQRLHREYQEAQVKIIAEREAKKEQERLTKAPQTAGSVYLVQSPTGAYKIGRARNPDNRLKTFNVKLPFEVSMIHVIRTDNMKELEKRLHQHFATKRINGEWFKLEERDIEYIKAIQS